MYYIFRNVQLGKSNLYKGIEIFVFLFLVVSTKPWHPLYIDFLYFIIIGYCICISFQCDWIVMLCNNQKISKVTYLMYINQGFFIVIFSKYTKKSFLSFIFMVMIISTFALFENFLVNFMFKQVKKLFS